MTRWIGNIAITLTVFDRVRRRHTLKLIFLTMAIVSAWCGVAQAQSISWLEKGDYLGSGWWFYPRLAGDASGDFLVVGQDATGSGPLAYQTGSYPGGSADWISWNYGNSDYGSGTNPNAALAMIPVDNANWVAGIEVHQGGQNNGSALWSHTAVSGWPITANLTWTNGVQYDTGFNPTVAIDPIGGFEVVEVHQAASGISNLWYHVGTFQVDMFGVASLTWGPAYQFDYGHFPSVSTCNGLAVEVHEGDSDTLWYSIGKIDLSSYKVKWGPSLQYENGYRPSVALCANLGHTGQYLVEVHQAGKPAAGKSTALWYHVSSYTSSTVTWKPAVKYGTGCSPTVTMESLNPSNLIAETHSAYCGEAAPLYYDLGNLIVP
jgi:hypothetical protein